jgi:hypothetical protein
MLTFFKQIKFLFFIININGTNDKKIKKITSNSNRKNNIFSKKPVKVVKEKILEIENKKENQITFKTQELNEEYNKKSLAYNKLLEYLLSIFIDNPSYNQNIRKMRFVNLFLEERNINNVEPKEVLLTINKILNILKAKEYIVFSKDYNTLESIQILNENEYIKYSYEKYYNEKILLNFLNNKLINEEEMITLLENITNSYKKKHEENIKVIKKIELSTLRNSIKNIQPQSIPDNINDSYKILISFFIQNMQFNEQQNYFIETYIYSIVNYIYSLYEDLNKTRNFNEEIILIKKLFLLLENNPVMKGITIKEIYSICNMIKDINSWTENNKLFFYIFNGNSYNKYLVIDENFYKNLIILNISFRIIILSMLKNNIINNVIFHNFIKKLGIILSKEEIKKQYCKLEESKEV